MSSPSCEIFSALIVVLTLLGIPAARRWFSTSIRLPIGADHPTQPIVEWRKTIDRHAAGLEPGRSRARDLVLRQRTPTGLHAAIDPVIGDRLDDVDPVAAQVGLPADQRDFTCAQLRELGHHVQAFRRGELGRALPSGP
jgi:hypothetical protein